MLPLNEVLGSLESFQAKPESYPADIKRAAVCMILQQTEQGLALLMIQRAEYEGDPWSGHMAFPGGRVELEDASSLAGAERECLEEIGLDLSHVARLITPLSEMRSTLRGRSIDIVVSPYVFLAEKPLSLTLNREVADTVSIPLGYFLDSANRDSFTMSYESQDHEMPCCYYENYKVWGLSLRFIDELMRVISP